LSEIALTEQLGEAGQRAIAVRTPRYEFISAEDGREEFYDLQEDRDELTSVIAHRGEVRDLLARLAHRAREGRGTLNYRSWLDADARATLEALGLAR
jgi:hypothetical protein